MKPISHLSIAALALLAAACGSDPQAANHGNFAASLEAWHEARPVCVSMRPAPPVEIRVEDAAAPTPAMDALVEAGLLTATPITRVPDAFTGGGSQPVPHVRYETTPAAAETIRPSPNTFLGGTDLCFARRAVVAVRGNTEPGEMAGVQMTRVTYAWSLDDIAPWADSPAIRAAYPAIAAALDAPEGESTETLILTDSGWTHQSLIG